MAIRSPFRVSLKNAKKIVKITKMKVAYTAFTEVASMQPQNNLNKLSN